MSEGHATQFPHGADIGVRGTGVDAAHEATLARKMAMLAPVVCIKG